MSKKKEEKNMAKSNEAPQLTEEELDNIEALLDARLEERLKDIEAREKALTKKEKNIKKASQNQEQIDPSKLGYEEQPTLGIGLKIKAPFDKMAYMREKTYMRLQDKFGQVKVKVFECGCNLVFKTIDHFPKHNLSCLCGRPDHFLIKFEVTD